MRQGWYFLSKTLAERAAFAYAKETGLDVVSVCPSWCLGPLLQPTVNNSSLTLIDYLKGKKYITA
jgi:nucleoside-diphosphate-sugar epimerase